MKPTPFWILALVLALIRPSATQALTNGLALTPPMGFNTWYTYYTSIHENLIKGIADAMATNGLKAAGYDYVCLDDGWAGYRDTNGFIVPDTNKFPHGMKALADYVHGKGLKLGLYTTFGHRTCAGLPGSCGHVIQDANTYAGWGVDYLKYEGCSSCVPPDDLRTHYEWMADALLNCGRPILFNGSIDVPAADWMPVLLNSWRGTGDNTHTFANLLHHLDFVARTPSLAGPGHWNDADVLEVGVAPFSQAEAKVNMSMWCIVAAPLFVSTLNPAYLGILTNPEVVAVDQDAAGIPGVCVATNGDLQVWCKPIGGNPQAKVVALLNRSAMAANITAQWGDLGLPSGRASVRDLWARAYVGSFTNSYTAQVPAHAVELVKIALIANASLPPSGTNYLSDLQWLASTITTNPYPTLLDRDTSGSPIRLHGVTYTRGVGTVPNSRIDYLLGGVASRFFSDVGVDDAGCCGRASVVFRVRADGTLLYDSGLMTSDSDTLTIDVDLTGRSILSLEVTDAGDGFYNDHADWAGARIAGPVPPRIGRFMLTGEKIVVHGTGGTTARPGGSYCILTATTPDLPVVLWRRLATNRFDGSGDFTFTSAVDPTASSTFYRLQLPWSRRPAHLTGTEPLTTNHPASHWLANASAPNKRGGGETLLAVANPGPAGSGDLPRGRIRNP